MLADKADLTGARLVLNESTGEWSQKFFPHSVISQAIHYAENNPNEQPILFLDEINRTTSDVTSGTLTLVTLRRIGDKALPKNLRIIVAGNDKGNVTALDDASVSRFAIINVEPDAHTLIDVLGDNLHPWVKMVLKKHPETIFVKNVDDQQAVEGSDDDDENATTRNYLIVNKNTTTTKHFGIAVFFFFDVFFFILFLLLFLRSANALILNGLIC